MNLRPKILLATDRILALSLVVLVLGSAVCFGGAIWWFRPAFAGVVFLLAMTMLIRLAAQGRSIILKSPLTFLGILGLVLGGVQLVPLPPWLAQGISPTAHAIYMSGAWPKLVQADDPTVALGEPAQARSPSTLDRAATLRWLMNATLCLAIFWVVSHYADRLGRLYLVSGCVVAAFLLNGALGLVQVAGQADGLVGYLLPGRSAYWAPSLDDLLESPTTAAMRPVGESTNTIRSNTKPRRIALMPERPFLFGTMMGGAGAFLALGSLALPLSLAIVLHLVSPRGSRESFGNRLSHSGHGGLVVLLMIMVWICSFLVGMMAGPWYCFPFAVGLITVGLFGMNSRGSRVSAIASTLLMLLALGSGAALIANWVQVVGGPPPFTPTSWEAARVTWSETLALLKEFPIVGAGLGTFASVHPYFKAHDAYSTTAMSSFVQCAAESGIVGLGILGMAALWSLCRVPFCLGKVGTADRTLAHGLLGAALGFSLWFVFHWSIELPAVAIAASAMGGLWNRWMAGGTDLFVERA